MGGSPSYELYKQEYDGIFSGLQKRATALYEAFKEMEGVECDDPQGSMYLFPTIKLPPRPLKPPRKKVAHQMSSTPSVFSMRREFVSLLDLALARRRILFILERLSSHRAPNGWAESRSSTVDSWMSSDEVA